jgi:hypothetical protein
MNVAPYKKSEASLKTLRVSDRSPVALFRKQSRDLADIARQLRVSSICLKFHGRLMPGSSWRRPRLITARNTRNGVRGVRTRHHSRGVGRASQHR